MIDSRANFLSASEIPVKLFYMKDQVITGGCIKPIHIGIHPTNRCNAQCPWCSHQSCDRSVELPIEEIRGIAAEFSKLGTMAVTVSGGGEPTVHQDFPAILETLSDHGFEIGLSTNGIKLLDKTTSDIVNRYARWVRLSCHLQMSLDNVKRVCDRTNCDLGLSLVVSQYTESLVRPFCEFAERQENVMYIRLVQEICNLDDGPMHRVSEDCCYPKTIIQWRNNFTKGRKNCFFSRLRPLIDCTGSVYPCCGTQYALGENHGMVNPKFRLGNWRDYSKTGIFDGSICSKCYYDAYNRVLATILEPPKHHKFV